MTTLDTENLTGVNREWANPNRPLKYLTASSIIGDKVRNDKDEHMGEIEDIMIDITTGKIEYYIIKFGGFITIGQNYFLSYLACLRLIRTRKYLYSIKAGKCLKSSWL